MKQVDTTLFGRVDQPESAKELIDLIYWNDPSPDNEGWVWPRIWRGQADIRWPVHSTAYRRLAAHPVGWRKINDDSVSRYEKDLLRRATHRGFRIQDGRVLDDMELLARLRHYGAAVRLVDATRSALVAAWFVAAERPRTTGALIGLHTHHLGGYEGLPARGGYDDVMRKLGRYEYPITWEPSAVSPRVAAQHSQFLYSAVDSAQAGSLRMADGPGATWIIAVEPTVKAQLLQVLDRVHDLSARTLFPDLEGFARVESWENDPNVGRW